MKAKVCIRLLSSLLVVILLSNAGCSQVEVTKNESELAFVELNMYLIGEKPEDADMVYNELNKLIKAELNAQLNVHFIPWEDREQKYPQILSSGVAVDLIYTSDWCYYDTESRKGTLREISKEDIQKYMPLTFKNQPEETYLQAMIDEKMYMVPNYQEEFADYKLVLIRGDLREKYGLEPLKTVDDLANYYNHVINYDPAIIPYSASLDNKELTYVGFWQETDLIRINSDNKASSFAIAYQQGKTAYELINILETQEYIDYLEKMRQWYVKGFWPKNAIANKETAQSAFEKGQSASLIWNIGTLNLSAITVNNEQPQWKPEIYDLTLDAPKMIAKYSNNGMAISKQSSNYERSLMLLDKLKQDQRYWNLTWLGIEGVHWKSIEPQMYGLLQDSERYPYAGTSCWGWGNVPFQRVAETTPLASTTLIETWTKEKVSPKTNFFRFNDATVKSEISACLSILSRYLPILELGMAEDVQGTYQKMMLELKQAGWDTYETEFRKQYVEFLD
jgi:putative aldouronate transport system substrate-binding protein